MGHAFANAALVLVVALLAAETHASRYVVQVEPGTVDQVATKAQAAGLQVVHKNKQFSYLVLQDVSAGPVAAAAAAAGGGGGGSTQHQRWLPEWLNSSPGELPGTNITVAPDGSHVSSRDSSSGSSSTAADQPTFRQQQPATVAAAAAAEALAVVQQQLSAVAGVVSVAADPVRHLLAPPEASSTSDNGSTGGSGSSACPIGKTADVGPDADTGRVVEGAPYGISLVEGTDETMVALSRQYRDKVLFCVIDTGLDISNSEFDKERTSGCVPGKVRPLTNTRHNCEYNWWEDYSSHGTHTSGTIAALRNGDGIVGVSAEGALIYHHNVFGPRDQFYDSELVLGWQDCINELDEQKAARNMPDMKLVISMSFGGTRNVSATETAVRILAGTRSDVIFIASSGNSGSSEKSYPAAYTDVVAVGAVDWTPEIAAFSTYNADVEWSAPGVSTLSTVPFWSRCSSRYNKNTVQLSASPFTPPADDPNILNSPTAVPLGGASSGCDASGQNCGISGPLVDCGLGLRPCENAAGKICLIQRGEAYFCRKVLNCVAGGGIGVLIYNKDTEDSCAPFAGTLLPLDPEDPNGCGTESPANGWPVAMSIARKQGEALRQALFDAGSLSVKIETCAGSNLRSLNYMSGTSMACPTAAGVAGLVWSAHSACTSSELRVAISSSAQDLGSSRRDDFYGFGMVKAAAAHKWLLANPCAGELSGPESPALSPPPWSPTPPSPPESPTPSSPPPPPPQPPSITARDDSFSAVSGSWTALDVLVNDMTVSSGSVLATISSVSSSISGAIVRTSSDGLRLRYRSKVGWTGKDRLTYTITDLNGVQTTAWVTVQVGSGSCRGSLCSPSTSLLGACSSGKCVCKEDSGLTATFVRNADALLARETPFVPACRYPPFKPAFGASVMSVVTGDNVELKFTLGSVKKCLRKSIVNSVTYEATGCATPGQSEKPVRLPATTATPGASGCSKGVYSFVFRVKQPPGCYDFSVELNDSSKRVIKARVVSD